MTWTFVPAQIQTTPLYQVRVLSGDKVFSDPQMEDEEILFILSQRPNVYGAAANVCQALANQYSRSVTTKAGDTQKNWSDMAKSYQARAAYLNYLALINGGGQVYAGGISISDKISQEQNTDRVQPQFDYGMDDNLEEPVGPVGPELPLETEGGVEPSEGG